MKDMTIILITNFEYQTRYAHNNETNIEKKIISSQSTEEKILYT